MTDGRAAGDKSMHDRLHPRPGARPRPRPGAGLLLWLVALAFADAARAQGDGYVLFLDEYLYGDFYVASLPDVDGAADAEIVPRRLRLSRGFGGTMEIGNADVAYQGSTMVFGARDTRTDDWGIYTGTIDIRRSRIAGVEALVQTPGAREEDPRFSWDGQQVVYKCDGNICIYPETRPNPVVASECELWAPSFAASGFAVSYTKRCAGDPQSDRIWYFDLLTRRETQVPNQDGGPDRFAYFLDDGRIVYSHSDPQSAASSLWVYDSGATSLLHDRTVSDDDAYPDKHDREHIVFIGWEDDGYKLFMYRQSRRDSIRLNGSGDVLGPVMFR
jgi:hypothetical protein